jgi:hypothetical protein
MKYFFYIIAIIFIVYTLTDLKKKSNANSSNTYQNSLYYRVLILAVFGAIALIISFFVKQNH